MDIFTQCIKKRKDAIIILSLIAVYLTLNNFHRKKHSSPLGAFFKSALFSATEALISFIYGAKGQSS